MFYRSPLNSRIPSLSRPRILREAAHPDGIIVMTSPASRVLDVDKEDGEERSPLAGLFPTTLPVKSLVESLAQPAQRFPKRTYGAGVTLGAPQRGESDRAHGAHGAATKIYKEALCAQSQRPVQMSLFFGFFSCHSLWSTAILFKGALVLRVE